MTTKAKKPATVHTLAQEIHPRFAVAFDAPVPTNYYQTLSITRDAGSPASSVSALIAPRKEPERFDMNLQAKGLTADQIKRLTKILAE